MFETITSFLESIIINFRFTDFIDITIVTIVLYFVFKWFRQQTSKNIIIGIFLLLLTFILSQKYNLYLTSIFYQAGFTVLLVALVLIFQQDLRRMFDKISAWSFKNPRAVFEQVPEIVDVLVKTISQLAKDKIGALIIIKGREPIHNHVRGGIELNGKISLPLLVSIFHHDTPGHDGALIIENGIVTKFGVHLPLSRNLQEVGQSGTRHTAGLGLAELCDSEVIIVSEERGTITNASQGKLVPVESAVDLKERLTLFFKQTGYFGTIVKKRNLVTGYLGIKVFALFTAILLWLLFAFRVEIIQKTFEVPIEYRNIPDTLLLDSNRPSKAEVTLTGPERSFDTESENIVISLNMANVKPGLQEVLITSNDINESTNISVEQINPQTLEIITYKLTPAILPVSISTIGKLKSALQLIELISEPKSVNVLIVKEKIGLIGKLKTESLDLNEISENGVFSLGLIIPEYVKLISDDEKVVTVSIKVK
ncbi:MAG: diadenylate cyclase [Melioribacteraceae bacterium]|nr:diadenylate cyclase [Melioribacteraceae bacterium]